MGTDKTYQQALNTLEEKAQQEFIEFWDRLDLEKPWECKNALCDFVPLLIQKYEQSTSVLALNYFELAINEEYEEKTSGKVIDSSNEEDLKNSVSYFCRHLFGE